MRLLITGAKGQLGKELMARAPAAGWQATGADLPELDICDLDGIVRVLAERRPAAVINAAAYTAVDQAESQPEVADRVNRLGPALLAEACRQAEIALVHVSTDFVFDGDQQTPYTEDDPVHPLSVYGRTKAAGEAAVRQILRRHLIVRTAWLYAACGNNFVRTMLRLGREREKLRVVADQFGSPTCAADLADALLTVCARALETDGPWGTYHYCGAGVTSWYGLAETAIAAARLLMPMTVEVVEAIPTADYPTAACRPAYSALDCSRIQRDFGIRTRFWPPRLIETVRQILVSPTGTDF